MVRAGQVIRANDVAVQACRVTRTSALSVGALSVVGTVTVSFNDEIFDTDGMHSTTTNTSRITINTAGFYMIGFHGTFVTAAAGVYTRIFCEFILNGSTSLGRCGHSGNAATEQPTAFGTTMYQFNAGDYVEVQVGQQSGGAKDLEVTANRSPQFWAARIGS